MGKRLVAMISSGKDGWYAAYLMKKQGHELVGIFTMHSENPDSFMFHTPNVDLTALQSASSSIPLHMHSTTGLKEDELKDLTIGLRAAKDIFKAEGIITGALFSDYQRERIEKICKELDLECHSPLWHMDQEQEMRSLLEDKFTIIIQSVAAEGLDASWLNKVITNQDIDKLVDLKKRLGINVAGEGGEFESLVLDCPLFNKRLEIKESKIIEGNHTARLIIDECSLSDS